MWGREAVNEDAAVDEVVDVVREFVGLMTTKD